MRRYALLLVLISFGLLFSLAPQQHSTSDFSAPVISISSPSHRPDDHEKVAPWKRLAPPHQSFSDTMLLANYRAPFEYDLSRIVDPIDEIVVADARDLTQIHHGVYKTNARLRDGKKIQFALKTECRPAAKWHGQQGWSEIAVFYFTRLFYGAVDPVMDSQRLKRLATAAPARGVVVSVSEEVITSAIHRDRCGVMTEVELDALARARGLSGLKNPRKGYRYIIGVALTWQPRHHDDALPPLSYKAFFAVGSVLDPLAGNAELREEVSQISDVMTMDYLLTNEDREEKNWFRDDTGRFVMMDNGWAFAGRSYKGSICGEERTLLSCPPLLRRLSKKCNGIAHCRFRRETTERLRRVRADWNETLGSLWVELLRRDTLIGYLLEAYGQATASRGPLQYNEGLARYIQGCPSTAAGHLLDHLKLGIGLRLERLAAHIAACDKSFGERYVYGDVN
jgi:hypothetical protein